MKCSACGQNESVVVITSLDQRVWVQRPLCDDCVRRLAAEDQPSALQGRLLSLLSGGQETPACAGCGLKYETFRGTGRLGCAACYEAFEAVLAGLLPSLHGASSHTGKRPEPKLAHPVYAARSPSWPSTATRPTNKTEELAAMEARLKRVVESEDFDAAVRLRDEIRRLKAG